MSAFRLRSTFVWLMAASLLLVTLTLLALMRLSSAADSLSEANANRYESYLLADMLRQSSDDLTRLARTYVVSADPSYEQQYWDILAIRNGEKPMPEAYHRIYWDFVAAGDSRPRPEGAKVGLLDLMKKAGFTEAEFARLNEAKANSDGLVRTETIAMNAVKGKFDDGNGGFSKSGPPDMELARRLMHDKAYHQEKAKIMKPVDAFYVLMEQRTQAAIDQALVQKQRAQWLVWLAIVVNLLGVAAGLLYAYRKLVEVLGGEPEKLAASVRRIASGDYDTPLQLASGDRASVLAQVSDMQDKLKDGADLAAENARVRAALDAVSTGVMITDDKQLIQYVNPAQTKLLADAEAELRREQPQFNAQRLIGENLASLLNDANQARTIAATASSAQTIKLNRGSRRFKLVINAIIDRSDKSTGLVVEWADETEALAQREREIRIANERARINAALDGASVNVMIADNDRKIIYMNAAVIRMMREAEADLRKIQPQFSVEQMLGSSMDSFHRQPGHQANLLANLNGTHNARIVVGTRHFNLFANPIRNAQGERLGSVVEWNDITREVGIEKEVASLIQAANMGDFSRRIDMHDKEGFFKILSENLNSLMEVSDRGLSEVVNMLGALAQRDLTQRMDGEYFGAFGQLKDDSNATAEKLGEIIVQIKEAADAIRVAAREIAQGNLDLSRRTEDQADGLANTSGQMKALTDTVKQNASYAKQANELAHGASAVAMKGGGIVAKVVETMDEINASAKKVVDIISVVDGIAFQTNILALNAAVEAARAGEQGRGFAVVAGEVRNLAQRSAAAAKEIKTLIGDSVSKVDSGSKLVGEAGSQMQEIVASVKSLTNIMSEISSASDKQSIGLEQVNATIVQMDEMTQQNAALVEQAAASAQSMAEQSDLLADTVAAFRLNETERPSRTIAQTNRSLPAPTRATRNVKPQREPEGDSWETF